MGMVMKDMTELYHGLIICYVTRCRFNACKLAVALYQLHLQVIEHHGEQALALFRPSMLIMYNHMDGEPYH